MAFVTNVVSTPCKGLSSITSNVIVLRAWPRMFYEQTLCSLQPPSKTQILLLLLLDLTCGLSGFLTNPCSGLLIKDDAHL